MATAAPSLDRIKKILGKYSIASVRSWLKRKKLPHTMNTREAMAVKVHDLVEKGEITEEQVIEGAIGIEEASSKRTFLYRMPKNASDLAKIDKQLADLKIPLSTERTPSVSPTPKPQRQYVINGPAALRAKWNE